MSLASSLRKTASKLVKQFGGTVTYRQVAGGSYNATTGTITETETNTTIKGVLDAVQKQEVNELIQDTDKKLTIAAADLTITPSTADRVVINSVGHQIVKIGVIEQDNTAIAVELFLRA